MLYATSTRIIAYAASMSYRGWLVSIVLSALTYLYNASTLSHPRYNSPCVRFGAVMRVLYGLFATDFAHYVLGSLALTREGEEQSPDSAFNTRVSTHGPPEMRIQLVPILGGLFGGNYSFLIWDDNDPQRRAIVVDPADPHVMLQAAKKERLQVELLLCTHWHFDHSAGNQTFKRFIPGIEVVASASERGRTPAVTKRVKDLDELQCGPRLTVRCHHVPGHTHGSIVYEVVSKAKADGPEGSSSSLPSAAFTGDTLFCGGCGALFECSANTLHNSLGLLMSRLPAATKIYPGHEYSEMLMQMVCRKEPDNLSARRKLYEVKQRRRQQLPSIPSTVEEELQYNPYLTASKQQLAMMCGAAEDD